jgi:hypothetical protein
MALNKVTSMMPDDALIWCNTLLLIHFYVYVFFVLDNLSNQEQYKLVQRLKKEGVVTYSKGY